MALLVKEKKLDGLYIPSVNAGEAAVVKGINVYPVGNLLNLFHHLIDSVKIQKHRHVLFSEISSDNLAEFDLSDIKGQEQGKRVLEISAAGGHNLSMTGVPGAGKTMLARALPAILPVLTEDEALEVTKIYSVTGNI